MSTSTSGELARVEAIILSMTPQRAAHAARDRRLAPPADRRGSGTTVQQVNRLLNARKQMQKLMKQMGKGRMPKLPRVARRR